MVQGVASRLICSGGQSAVMAVSSLCVRELAAQQLCIAPCLDAAWKLCMLQLSLKASQACVASGCARLSRKSGCAWHALHHCWQSI
jgi:hypothetical protein